MYKYNNGWTLIGQPITAGNVVPAISDDGLTVIITTPVFDIIVYTYNGSTWVQLGETFSKNISTDTDFGKKISLSSDGRTLLYSNSIPTNTVTSNDSYIKVFKYVNNAWTQQGQTVIGTKDYFGQAYLSSDGLTFAVSASQINTTYKQGYVIVYKYNDSSSNWVQVGQTIYGNNNDYLTVFKISSDGSHIVTKN